MLAIRTERTTMKAISQTNFESLKLFRRGKVRDVYDMGDTLIIVATDRLSAFDVVLDDPIPMKGTVLTQISKFWFDRTGHITPNHCISTTVEDYPSVVEPHAADLKGRSMLVTKTAPLSIECVVRGYLTGSGLKEYRKTQSVCGIGLPDGLVDGSLLPEPLFTPSTKADEGHDENIDFEQAAGIIGREAAEKVRELSIELYTYARDFARKRGIIIADTKFEFGVNADGQIILIDEALTPDSSRFWPMDKYQPGQAQPSFDKQYIRDYLESVHWDKTPPAPQLPKEAIEKTTEKYVEAYQLITGQSISV
jgi:phosphoribosylaminoimidazole-succinocarboxamide synthase